MGVGDWRERVHERLRADDVEGAYRAAVDQAADDLDLCFEGRPRIDDVAVAAIQRRADELLRQCGVTVERDRIVWWEDAP